MKKHLIFLLFIVITSCSKSPMINEDNFNENFVNKELINEVKLIKESPVRLLAYSKLNQYEKCTLWKEHLYSWKDNGTLTEKQNEIIQSVIDFIQPKNWQTDMEKTKAGQSEKVAIILYKIKNNFSRQLAGKIFTDIADNYLDATNNYRSKKERTITAPETSFVYYKDRHYTCQCNEGSWALQCQNSPYNECVEVNVCVQNGTTQCGFMGWFQCNGDCFASAN